MEMSLDWSAEWWNSAWWIIKAFLITAPIFVIVLAILFVSTRWGRQFWRISGAYFTGRRSVATWTFVAVLLVITLMSVRLNVLLSYNSNDQFTSLQVGAQAFAQGDNASLDTAKSNFWLSVRVFALVIGIWVVKELVRLLIQEWFGIRWREWLNERVVNDYLDDQSYYRVRFIDAAIDNPDQRIQADVTSFVTTGISLALGAVRAIASMISFTVILWNLSASMTFSGVTVPKAMFWILMAYVLVSTVVAFWLGRPLIQLNFINEKLNAVYRYALVRLRDSAENVAFYHGERVERGDLLGRFAAVIRNYWAIVFRNMKFSGWNFAVGQSSVVMPALLQSPRVLNGEITLGALTQSSTAFGQVHDSLSYFRESYDTFAGYRASLIRLDGLLTADDQARKLPRITTSEASDAVQLTKIDVRKPDGVVLIDDLDLRLVPGDALVVKGASGSGKTTLLRALAQMWPYADGEFRRPDGNETLFLSQIPYLPLGDLRTAVSYPAEPGVLDDDALRATLEKVHLGHIADRLDEEEDWAKVLSPGEQQRIAFARILLLRPKVVFLDEATSAVDEGLEYTLYKLVRTEVPDTILVSVAHRSTVDQHHTSKLELDGAGSWNLTPIG